jgi:hypothetical protein
MTRMFQFGRHVIQVIGTEGRWMALVDGARLRGWHRSAADAWTSGVVEVDRLESDRAIPLPAAAESAR